ncbi:hypothetical protein [Micromonospora zhanjiangensis]
MRRRLRLILLVTGWLTLIVLVLLAAFGDARGTRHSLTMAGISTALVLLLGPGLRPPRGRRRPARRLPGGPDRR